MKKLSSMQQRRIKAKAQTRLSKEKMIALGVSALLMIALLSEQLRLALLNW